MKNEAIDGRLLFTIDSDDEDDGRDEEEQRVGGGSHKTTCDDHHTISSAVGRNKTEKDASLSRKKSVYCRALAMGLVLLVVALAAAGLSKIPWIQSQGARGSGDDSLTTSERGEGMIPLQTGVTTPTSTDNRRATYNPEEGPYDELHGRRRARQQKKTNKKKRPQKRQQQHWYLSHPDDPIPVSMRLIDPLAMEGYPLGQEGCYQLTEDLYNASAIIANEYIKDTVRRWNMRYRYYKGGIGGSGRPLRASGPPEGNVEDAVGRSSDGEDAYDTNNQETGVDEADIIKSDGEHVYIAYGDILVVTNALTGEEVSRTKVPERKVLTWAQGGYEYDYDLKRKAKISGLLLDSASERIVVIVSGYGSRFRDDYPFQPALSMKGDTKVLLYDTSSLQKASAGDRSNSTFELPLISSVDVDGEYLSARSIDGVAHIVRRSDVETSNHITSHLSRYHDDYLWDSKDTYVTRATSKAKMLLSAFSHRLAEELRIINGGTDCSTVTRVAMFASVGDDGDDSDRSEGYPDMVSDALLKSYLQVSSFDIASPPLLSEDSNDGIPAQISASTIGSFFPSTDSEIYASKDVLVVAGRGYNRDTFTRSWGQSTYFLSYNLNSDGSAPSGLAIGVAPGYLLNQFSMDEYKGFFRVATTQQARWACAPYYKASESVRHHPFHPRRCRWEMASESKSQVTVFKFPVKFGEMELITVIDNLGVTEEIKSVRFFDDKAYVVTFMQTDPLYSIDFSDPESPFVAGELKISGFSSYLHPLDNDTRLIAIGKHADEATGQVTGFQVTLFDVSDLNDTKVLQRHTINQRWASSQAEQDHLAFRYLPQSKQLIIPVSIDTSWVARGSRAKDFDGFKVFSVSDEGIEQRFSISMASGESMKRGCWYDAYLAPRSMVFGGNLSVFKGHGYSSYDLSTERMRWSHNLDRSVKNNCQRYWG